MTGSLVSAIIAVRDGQAYLAEAIESVLSQTYRPMELVVVDDGSTDGGPAIAEGYGERVRLLRQAAAGVGPARNAGIAVARGEMIAFCDHDDVWEPRKVARQVDALAADPGLGAVLTMVREFLSPELDPATAPLHPAPGPLVGAMPSAFLARRSTVDAVGVFDDTILGHWTDWYARLKEGGHRIAVVDEVLVHRRVHDANLGLRYRGDRQDYLRALKASLDRRRARGNDVSA
jgi:glycosyltransferase involved in cell wall biosynthesis